MFRPKILFGLSLFAGCCVLMSAHRSSPLSSWSFTRRLRGSQSISNPVAKSIGKLIFDRSQLSRQSWRQLTSTDPPAVSDSTKKDGSAKSGTFSPPPEKEYEECTLTVVNDLNEAVVFCWVDFDGKLRNFYTINDRSIQDGSVHNRHDEYTSPGHCFVCFRANTNEGGQKSSTSNAAKYLRDLNIDQIVFIYVPIAANGIHKIHLQPVASDEELSETKRQKRWGWLSPASSKSASKATAQSYIGFEFFPEHMNAEENELIDSSSKQYNTVYMCGFQICYEPGVFENVPHFSACFEADLQMLRRLLPPKACSLLQESTPIWVNEALTYGTKAQPVVATSCCFHPIGGASWLRKHGLSERKEGGIEIGSAKHYVQSRKFWGTGGILVHEFSHAYHNKYLPKGYENEELRARYDAAMRASLYDCVDVHCESTSRTTTEAEGIFDGDALVGNSEDIVHEPRKIVNKMKKKAYACANVMEFFAELSTAFHYSEKDELEYNKWFPHNHQQLLAHDPETWQLLGKLWHVHDD